MTDYANSSRLAADAAFNGRVSQCMMEQARAKLDAAKEAGIDVADLVLAYEIALAPSSNLNPPQPVKTAVSLMASDPAFAESYAGGPQGDQQAGVTDGQILSAVNVYWHPIATG